MGKTKIGLIICGALVAMLAVSNIWYFARVEDLQNQVDVLEAEKDALQSEFMALNASYVRLNADYSEMSLRFNELSVNYSNLTKIFGLLQEDYGALSKNYSSLLASYDSLANSYDALRANYSTLLSTYHSLQEQYFGLNDLYETLENTYNNLSQKYETLLELWDEPLEYVVTPTWDEVIAWLETDETDALLYDPDKFLCGDFSIMLIQHAKAMNWRMLFTVLEFDYYEENPTGVELHHGDNAHAFVSTFTTEGIVYIEPQTDFTWYVHPTGDNETHVEFSDWVFIDFEGDWFGHIFVQYYNRCAGADVEPIETRSRSIEVEVPYQLSKN